MKPAKRTAPAEGVAPLLAAPDSLCGQSANTLAAQIRAGNLSASTLLEAHLERIAAVNPCINALVTVDIEAACDRARALDADAAQGKFAGPLHGLPVAVKDIFATQGLRSTYGSRRCANYIPDYDALHVARLRAAGAVILGKSNTSEYAYGAQTTNPLFGVTRNPHDLSRTVSGSSGGAAAALAAGLVPLADGSDLGGSIRAPAGFCGVVGLRPTARVVPLQGSAQPFDSLNTPGVLTRSLADAALMLKVMAGPASEDPMSLALGPARKWPIKELKIAWCMTPGGAPVATEIAAALAPLRDTLVNLGAHVSEADPDLRFMLNAQQTCRDWSARLEIGPNWQEDFDLFGPELQRTLLRAEKLSLADLEQAIHARHRGWERMQAFFSLYDVCVWPSNSQLPYGAEADVAALDLDETATLVTPLLGLPALSVPFGMASTARPASVQFIGPRHSDLDLLHLAAAVT